MVFLLGSSSSDAPYNPIITHAEAAKLLNSLLKLRQACCHPQVGSSGLRSLQQSPLTMDEILMVCNMIKTYDHGFSKILAFDYQSTTEYCFVGSY